MKEISFFGAELALALVWILLRLLVWTRQRRIDWRREAQLLLMYINLAVILRVVFFPMERQQGRVQPLLFDASAILPLRVNLRPLKQLLWFASRRDLLLNLGGNVCLFIPSGIILPILYRRLNKFWKVTAAGALLSLCVELLQLPFFTRATDVDDLLLNTLGVMLGYGLYALCGKAKTKRPDS